MPDYPMLQGNNFISTEGENTADTTGVTVTSAVGGNSKGSYSELVASTPFDAVGLWVFLQPTSQSDFLVDIAVGAAASEKVLVENIQLSAKSTEHVNAYYFPLAVPAGVRLSARAQASAGTQTLEVIVVLVGRSFLHSYGLGRCTTYGANTADSGGAGIDPGGTANTKGSYTEIVASTTNPIRQLLVVIGDRNNNVMTAATWLLDIAIGAAASEKVILPDLFLAAGTASDQITPAVLGPFAVNIPAGTRLAARAQCTIIDATDRLPDVTLYGMD